MNLTERKRLHELTIEQLQQELKDAETALLNFRFDAGLNRLTNPAGMHNARKQIARLKTLIREKELITDMGFSSMDEYKAFKQAERKSYRAQKAAR